MLEQLLPTFPSKDDIQRMTQAIVKIGVAAEEAHTLMRTMSTLLYIGLAAGGVGFLYWLYARE